MGDTTSHDSGEAESSDQSTDESSAGRVDPEGGRSDVEREAEIDYLDVEINLLKPATPFMRDHNRVILTGFALWVIFTFGPITATRLAPGLMTTPMPILEFPFHYFAIGMGAPSASLLLSVWYARKRDRIDEKYGIEQHVVEQEAVDPGADETVATDGGAGR